MKTIVLIRHAKAKKSHKLKDFDRPLKKRGLKDAPLIGKALKEHQLLPGLIISSPAERAFTTARLVAREFNLNETQVISEPRLYLESKSKLLEVINQVEDSFSTIFIVGHNPGLTDLANALAADSTENIPTSGALGIQFDCNTWAEVQKGEGKMILSETPKKTKKKQRKSEKQVL
jgi:phosphohistidine phosphatase